MTTIPGRFQNKKLAARTLERSNAAHAALNSSARDASPFTTMFPRRRLENVDRDLDFDTKTQIGRELKEEWLRCKSASDESPHLQNIMEMLHRATFITESEDVPWQESLPGPAHCPWHLNGARLLSKRLK
jgi:hypothetical protein